MIAGDGQPDLRAVFHGDSLLYQPFAEGTAADYDSPVVVLHGTGDYLAGRG